LNALTLLKQDHKMVGNLIDDAQECEPGDEQLVALCEQIAQALTVHASLEEKLFYPKLRDRADDDEDRVDVFEAYTEHDVVKHLISLLTSRRKNDEQFKAELQVLGESVKHHVKEEESTIFSLARELLDSAELDELGDEMAAAKKRLTARHTAAPNGHRKTVAKRNGGRKSLAH
jgi:hemerythrin superfamily protein